jgi:hypothetical protein
MKRLSFAITSLLLAALACNLPGAQNQGTDAAFTAAAETVAVELTAAAQTQAAGGATVTSTPGGLTTSTATVTTAPSATPQPATATPQPCNLASFVSDVTHPDDTQVPANQAFTKIWRFKNVGTCTWTSSYQLVFDHGDQMGGPVSQSLTGGVVPPGATHDVSVNLVAPGTAGTYRGYWRFRDPSGVLFGINTGSFWVQIRSVAPSPTPTLPALPPAVVAETVEIVSGESGSVRSNGSVLGVTNVGDVDSTTSSQAFVSFDISGLPTGVTVLAVKFNFTDYDTLENPFAGLGCLRMYEQGYGSLDAGDYFGGSPSGALGRWCNTGQLDSIDGGPNQSSLVSLFQSRLGNSRIRFRLQFDDAATDGDGVGDMVRFGTIKFVVSYQSP